MCRAPCASAAYSSPSWSRRRSARSSAGTRSCGPSLFPAGRALRTGRPPRHRRAARARRPAALGAGGPRIAMRRRMRSRPRRAALRPGRGPLLRLAPARTPAEEHVLLLTMHHIVRDGWSTWACCCARFRRLYGALLRAAGRRRCPSCRCSTPTSPSGSARWLQGEVAGSGSSPTGARQLAGAPAAARAAHRPAAAGGAELPRRAIRAASLPAELARALRRAGRRRGRHAVHDAARRPSRRCSARYSGQDDVAGRHAGRRPQPGRRSRG